MPRGRKKRYQLSKTDRAKIVREFAKEDNQAVIAEKFDISRQTISRVLKEEREKVLQYKDKLDDANRLGAGIVANNAIEALKKKDLDTYDPLKTSVIAKNMHVISTGNGNLQAVQVNVNLPTTVEEALKMLESTDNSANVESASNNTEEPITHENQESD